jgi:hypothetical protein
MVGKNPGIVEQQVQKDRITERTKRLRKRWRKKGRLIVALVPPRQTETLILWFLAWRDDRREHAQSRDAGGTRSAPDRLLAGVRPVWVSRAVNAGPSAGEVGEPAAVQLGFDVHGLGKLHTHYFNSHSDSRMRTASIA